MWKNNIVKNIIGKDVHSRNNTDFGKPSREDTTIAKFLHTPVKELRQRQKNIIECEMCYGEGTDEHNKTCKKCAGAGSYVKQ